MTTSPDPALTESTPTDMAKTKRKDDKVNWGEEIKGAALLLAAVLGFHSFIAKPFYIPSESMVPTLMALNGVKERLGKGIYTPTVEAKAREAVAQAGKALKLAKAEGVTIAFGTDAGVFEHGRNAGEFALMVDWGGMTPREALASATTVAAKLLDKENEIGKIAPGYSADIIAVDGDPLTDVRSLEKVGFVMARGRIID